MSTLLAASLQIGMQADSSIVAASVSLVETGSGKNPYSSFLAYRWDKPELMDFDYCIDRISVVPAGMMQGPTVTFFMDKKCITADGLIPTSKGILPGIHLDSWGHDRDDHVFSYEITSGKDSISVRDGFLMSSHYVSAKIALDHDCYWREYLDKFLRTLTTCPMYGTVVSSRTSILPSQTDWPFISPSGRFSDSTIPLPMEVSDLGIVIFAEGGSALRKQPKK